MASQPASHNLNFCYRTFLTFGIPLVSFFKLETKATALFTSEGLNTEDRG
jgi:hypothetical protein